MTLRELLAERNLKLDAASLIAGKDKATISRIAAGKSRAQPHTVVAMARGLGISARRMQAICDASWAAARTDGVCQLCAFSRAGGPVGQYPRCLDNAACTAGDGSACPCLRAQVA